MTTFFEDVFLGVFGALLRLAGALARLVADFLSVAVLVLAGRGFFGGFASELGTSMEF